MLDNFETVRDDPQVLGFVRSLPAPSAAILTSREAVRAGRTKWVRELEAGDAARLFTRWAQQAGWDGKGDGRQVETLCAELGHMPLAIELVAPQAASLPLATLLRRVRESLSAVADEWWDGMPRHRSVAAALQVSYDGLSDKAKRFFPCLAVFPSGANELSISEVCRVDDWEPAAELVNKGVARLEEQRYVLHPMVRRYRLELLEKSGEREAVERRAAEFFLALARFASSLVGTDEARLGLAMVEAERDNLLWGQGWWMEQGCRGQGSKGARAQEAWERVIAYAYALQKPLDVGGYWAERRQVLERALEAARLKEDRREQASMAHNLAVALQQMGDYPAAHRYYEQSLEITQALGDKAGVAFSYAQLALLEMETGNLDAACQLTAKAAEIFKAIGAPHHYQRALEQLRRLEKARQEQ